MIISENILHAFLKFGGSVVYAEWQYLPLILSPWYQECCLKSIFSFNANLVETRFQVELAEDYTAINPLQEADLFGRG